MKKFKKTKCFLENPVHFYKKSALGTCRLILIAMPLPAIPKVTFEKSPWHRHLAHVWDRQAWGRLLQRWDSELREMPWAKGTTISGLKTD